MMKKILVICAFLAALLLLAGCALPQPPLQNITPQTNISVSPPAQNITGQQFQPYTIPSKTLSLSDCSIPAKGVNFGVFADEFGRGYSESEIFGEQNYSATFEPGIWHNATDAPISFLGRNFTISKIHLKECAPDEKAVLKVGESISRYGYKIKLNGISSPVCEGCEPRAELLVSGNWQEKSKDLVPDTGFRFEATGLPGIAVGVQGTYLPKDITQASAQIATCQEDGGSLKLVALNSTPTTLPYQQKVDIGPYYLELRSPSILPNPRKPDGGYFVVYAKDGSKLDANNLAEGESYVMNVEGKAPLTFIIGKIAGAPVGAGSSAQVYVGYDALELREGDSLCGYKAHFGWEILDRRFFDMDALRQISLAKE